MRVKRYVFFIFWAALALHSLNKFMVRPWVIDQDKSDFLKIIVFSLPNFIEAIVGTFLITGIVSYLRIKNHFMRKWKDLFIYLSASLMAGVYVILQELKIHNLGGRNTYDPNDLYASIIGILFVFMVLTQHGYLKNDQP